MGLPKPFKFLFRFTIDIVIVVSIILFLPGVPPRTKFEAYDITPPTELVGPLAPNGKLDKAEFLFENQLTGPESIAIRKGEIFTGVIGGDVLRIKNNKISVLTRFGKPCEGKWEESKCGRPLGMRFDSAGKLIVADSYYGIYKVDVDSEKVEQLVNTKDKIEGRPLMTVNDLDVGKDGSIYYTDSSYLPLQNTFLEFLSEPTGRFLKYNPITKSSVVLMNGIHFSNGVQLSKNEDYVLIAETCRFRVLKYYLKGEKAGKSEIFIDGLNGSPDNIRSDGRGGFLVSLIIQRVPNHPSPMDILSNYPLVRKFIARITSLLYHTVSFFDSLLPNEYTGKLKYYINHLEPVLILAPRKSIIVQLDEFGKVKGSLQNSNGEVSYVSEVSIDDEGKFAYLGSPYNHGIWKIKVSDMGLK